MPAQTWVDRYEAALDRARLRIKYDKDRIACGFTNNVDLVVRMDEALLERFIQEIPVSIDLARQTRADNPEDLVLAILQSVALGEGMDIPVADSATQDWLISRVDGRAQLGGSSAQVANTLSKLGVSTLAHLTGSSPEQISSFDRPDRLLVARNGEFRTVSDCVRPDDQTAWHVALEYTAGLRFTVDGVQHIAPADSRIIVSYDPLNAAFEIDQEFVALLTSNIATVRGVFLAGYSQVIDSTVMKRVMTASIDAIRTWRAGRADLNIHVEMGAMPHVHELAGVAESLALEVSSIGMNADEFRDLVIAWGLTPARNGAEMTLLLETARHRLMTPRISVHTASFAMSLTSGGTDRERDALLFGALVASTRARIGKCPVFADLEETLNVVGVHPKGLRLLSDLNSSTGFVERESGTIVVVPTLEVPEPKATVGLGDSFTAGVMAML